MAPRCEEYRRPERKNKESRQVNKVPSLEPTVYNLAFRDGGEKTGIYDDRS